MRPRQFFLRHEVFSLLVTYISETERQLGNILRKKLCDVEKNDKITSTQERFKRKTLTS